MRRREGAWEGWVSLSGRGLQSPSVYSYSCRHAADTQPRCLALPDKNHLESLPQFFRSTRNHLLFTASAQNAANAGVPAAFTFTSSNPGVLDIAPNGFACAGSWNAPLYTICTPAGIGVVSVTATGPGGDQRTHSGFRSSFYLQHSGQPSSAGQFSAARLPRPDRTSRRLQPAVQGHQLLPFAEPGSHLAGHCV